MTRLFRRAVHAYQLHCAREDARLRGIVVPLGVWVCGCRHVSLDRLAFVPTTSARCHAWPGDPAASRDANRTAPTRAPADRLVLGAATIVALLVGAAPAVGQSLSDGTPVNVVGPSATVLRADAHGQGRLVEAFGDVRRARNIAVIVPGVGWTGPLLSDERGAGRRHPAVQARSLLAAMQRQAPGAPAAVVIWLDYDPPAGINADAARSDRALDGAPRLASFVDSLALGHGERSVPQLWLGRSAPTRHPGCASPPSSSSALPGMDVSTRAALHTKATVWAGLRPRRPDRGRTPHPCGGIRARRRPDGDRLRARRRSRSKAHTGTTATSSPAQGSLRAIAQIATGQGATVAVPAP